MEVLNYLRENRLEMPVIIQSARRQEQDKIVTLSLGAMNRLRKMLDYPSSLINHFQSIRRIGYRFSGDGL